jgi:hypothetical protein
MRRRPSARKDRAASRRLTAHSQTLTYDALDRLVTALGGYERDIRDGLKIIRYRRQEGGRS